MSEDREADPPETEDESTGETLNAAEPASVARQTKKAQTWTAQRRQFWANVLSTEIGRKAIWEFLTIECSFGNIPIALSTSGHPDPMATMYWNGAKRVGDRLYDLLQRCDHGAVYQMRVECDGEFSSAKPRQPAR